MNKLLMTTLSPEYQDQLQREIINTIREQFKKKIELCDEKEKTFWVKQYEEFKKAIPELIESKDIALILKL